MSRPSVVKVHNSCCRTYTNKRKFEQFSARTGPDVDSAAQCKSLRSQTLNFNWKLDCFFCNAPCVKDERHPHRKPTAYNVETFEIREKVLGRCAERNDSWAHDVQSRLLVCCDLIAEEAVYHNTCHKTFFSPLNFFTTSGRPVVERKDRVFEEHCVHGWRTVNVTC